MILKVPVHLVGSSFVYTGRVEVFMNGIWGRICQNGWDKNAADVVCRESGFKKAVAEFVGSGVSDGTDPIVMSGLKCQGDEISLSHCPRSQENIEKECKGAKTFCEPGKLRPLVLVLLIKLNQIRQSILLVSFSPAH